MKDQLKFVQYLAAILAIIPFAMFISVVILVGYLTMTSKPQLECDWNNQYRICICTSGNSLTWVPTDVCFPIDGEDSEIPIP